MKGAPHITASVVTINPQVAKEILRRGTPKNVLWKRNRTITSSQVEKLKNKMDNGEWILAQPLMFDNEDKLLDGQHRMNAVIQHGKPVDFISLSGYEDITFGQIDSNIQRGIADWLTIKGEDLPKDLSPLLRHVWGDSNGMLPGKYGGGQSTEWNINEALIILEKYPELREALKAPGVSANGLLPRPLSAFLWWSFQQKDPEVADAFFVDLILARGQASETDPICVLRSWLVRNKESRKKEPQDVIAAICIKAWNTIRRQESVRHLRYVNNEKFPEVQ